MRPTCYLHQSAFRIGEKAVVGHIGIGLQIALILLQKFLGSSALPRRSVIEDHSRMIPVSDIRPKPARCGWSRASSCRALAPACRPYRPPSSSARMLSIGHRAVRATPPIAASIRPSSGPECRRRTREDFPLPMQRHMIGDFADDHLRQYRRSGRTLGDRLRRLGGRLDGALASVLLADVFDHDELRGNVFVALAGLLADAGASPAGRRRNAFLPR